MPLLSKAPSSFISGSIPLGFPTHCDIMQPQRPALFTYSLCPMGFLAPPNLFHPRVSSPFSKRPLSSSATSLTPAVITPKLPLRRQSLTPHLSIHPPTTPHHRPQPVHHPNSAGNSKKTSTSVSSSQSILYSPLLFSLIACPLSALSQDTSNTPATGTSSVNTFPENDALTNVLSTSVVVLLVYVTVGVLILTIRNFYANRNNERHLAVLNQLIKENPGSKTLFDSYDDIEQVKQLLKQKPGPSSKSNPLPRPGGNREFRRIEKKVRNKELRAEKRKKKLDDEASAVTSKDSPSSSSKSS
eukprot:GFKZ01013925.1.p1 GENE.GFKZ01013925.1~~GFKZ01013925.1.p1  ORF type:complete len:300 (+),score=35.73 GFKZ01013925.1:129-1028(+)